MRNSRPWRELSKMPVRYSSLPKAIVYICSILKWQDVSLHVQLTKGVRPGVLFFFFCAQKRWLTNYKNAQKFLREELNFEMFLHIKINIILHLGIAKKQLYPIKHQASLHCQMKSSTAINVFAIEVDSKTFLCHHCKNTVVPSTWQQRILSEGYVSFPTFWGFSWSFRHLR